MNAVTFLSLSACVRVLECDSGVYPQDDTGAGAGLGTATASVNRYIQQLAQEYSGDCKTSFDELSKIIQVGLHLLSAASIPIQLKYSPKMFFIQLLHKTINRKMKRMKRTSVLT